MKRRLIVNTGAVIELPCGMQKNKFRERIKKITDPILTQGPTTAKIRVRLDSRTIITIHQMAALAVWLLRYPDAKVISE